MAAKPQFRREILVEWDDRGRGLELLKKHAHPTVFTLLKAEMEDVAGRKGYARFRIYLLAERCCPDPEAVLGGRSYHAMIRRRPRGESSWTSADYVMGTDAPTLGEALWGAMNGYARDHPGDEIEFGGFYGFGKEDDERALGIYITDTKAFGDMFLKWCVARVVRNN